MTLAPCFATHPPPTHGPPGVKRDVYTAGNDIMELYAPATSLERYREFWITSNRFLARLYRSPLLTLSAIRGACPAGGCCLSLCCDYRIQTEQGTIGLNEVALGISVPKYWGLLMARIIGGGPAEKLLLYGRLVSPQEALKLGLVDEVVAKADLMGVAQQQMAAMLKAPSTARGATKGLLRTDFSLAWEAYCVGEADGAWSMLSREETVAMLGATLQRLSKGKQAPPAKL